MFGGVDAIKASDILGVVGGISDLAGTFLIKPGPQLAAGLVLKGIGLGTGVAQNIVGDDTIGQLLGRVAVSTPLVSPSLFPTVLAPQAVAPDGITPLNMAMSSQTANTRTDTIWSHVPGGGYTKSETVSILGADGQISSTNFTHYNYNSDGQPLSASTYSYNHAGVQTYSGALVPAEGGTWANATTTVTPPALARPQTLFSSNGENSHSVTVRAGGTLSAALLAQQSAGNAITLADLQAVNPQLTGNNLAAGMVLYIPQKLSDGSTTYHYAGGASVNSNPANGTYHMVVPNSEGGGQTVYSRSVDGDAGYTVRQTRTDAQGATTYEFTGHQTSLNGEVRTLNETTYVAPGVAEIAKDTNGDGVIDQHQLVTASNQVNDLYSLSGLLNAEYELNRLNKQSQLSTGYYENFTQWAAAQYTLTGTTGSGLGLQTPSTGFWSSPIGAFYDSQSAAHDNAASITTPSSAAPTIRSSVESGATCT